LDAYLNVRSAFAASTHRSFHLEISAMLTRRCALACAMTLFAFTNFASAAEVSRLTLADLSSGARFEIATADHVYRGELVDPKTGEAKLATSSDGLQFTQPRTVFLLGATQGRTADADGLMLVKMNQLQTGMRVELGIGSLDESDRRVTEPVRMIRVE
jgi:hypothetical protein